MSKAIITQTYNTVTDGGLGTRPQGAGQFL